MRALIILALFALLALAVWFAASAFSHLGGDAIPLYGYLAIAGGVLFSLAGRRRPDGAGVLLKPPRL